MTAWSTLLHKKYSTSYEWGKHQWLSLFNQEKIPVMGKLVVVHCLTLTNRTNKLERCLNLIQTDSGRVARLCSLTAHNMAVPTQLCKKM